MSSVLSVVTYVLRLAACARGLAALRAAQESTCSQWPWAQLVTSEVFKFRNPTKTREIS